MIAAVSGGRKEVIMAVIMAKHNFFIYLHLSMLSFAMIVGIESADTNGSGRA